MAANIESFVRATGTKPAWHGLGSTINPDATIEEKLAAAGMAWTVDSSPVFYNAAGNANTADGWKLFYRSDRPEKVIGVMSDQYKPVQPVEAFQFFERLSSELDLSFDTAGVLQGGSKYWALAKNNQSVAINGKDNIDDYLLVATANDGTMSTRIGPCRVRVVCQNTLTQAVSGNAGLMTVNHRSQVNWDNARNWVMKEKQDFQVFGDLMQSFANIEVTGNQAAEFVRKLVAPDWDGKGKVPQAINALAVTMSNGVGQREAGKTAYGLLNGVTRWTDHERRTRTTDQAGNENRLNSAWFGPSANLKQQAMDLLVKQCVGAWGHKSELVPVLRHTQWNQLAA